MDIDTVARLIEERRVETVKLGGADMDGVYRGKRVLADHFLRHLDGDGFPQCDVIFGWDIEEQVVGDLPFTSWHTGFPDILMRPDLSTFAVVPWEEGTASVVCDFYTEHGDPVEVAPRYVLRRVVDKAKAAGLRAYSAAEIEVRFFREDQESIRTKGHSGLQPLSPGLNCYSLQHASLDDPVIGRIRRQMIEYGVPVEAYNREHGEGMYEINLKYADSLAAADQTMLYKSGSKEIAAQMGLIPTFMAKLSEDVDGCSGHVHQSLWDGGGERNLFWDAEAEDHLSDTMRRYVGGLMATLSEFMPMYAGNINSYKRFVEGTWAPTNVTWGIDKRTVALRVVNADATSVRVENRVPGADLNAYLAFAATLAGGLHGIESGLQPPPPTEGDAYAVEDAPALPTTLAQAVARFEGSALARAYFGDAFVDHFSAMRRWEIKRYDRAVTDWERRRYFEMV
jgi:glutamine synthetase